MVWHNRIRHADVSIATGIGSRVHVCQRECVSSLFVTLLKGIAL